MYILDILRPICAIKTKVDTTTKDILETMWNGSPGCTGTKIFFSVNSKEMKELLGFNKRDIEISVDFLEGH